MIPLLWCDVETTGLDPATDALLEVGLIHTDENLVIRAKTSFVLAYQAVPGTVDARVFDMHTKSGLFEACSKSTLRLWSLDSALRAWFDAADVPPNLHWAGRNPHFDRAWLQAHAKDAYRYWHYRSFDMTTVETLCDITHSKKEDYPHRSLADLELEIRQLRPIIGV